MEPLKPETKARILQEQPEATPEDIEEYERLLAERFTEDPDLPQSPAVAKAARSVRMGSFCSIL